MSLYTLALFAHLLGVLGLFIGIGLQWTATLRLRRAQTADQVREWTGLAIGAGRLGPISGALLLTAGIYMVVTAWSMTAAWIIVSLAAMLLMMVFSMLLAARRLRAVQRAATDEPATGRLSAGLRRQIVDPVLWVSMQLAASTALGIVFMMTTKPTLVGSVVTVAVALALGGIVGGMTAKPRHNARAATRMVEQARLS